MPDITKSARFGSCLSLYRSNSLLAASTTSVLLSAAQLNPGPASLMDLGLREGFLQRVSTWDLGAGLTVHFASRLDQIHLKLYALVDQGLGKHEGDLRALEPTREELIRAAWWTRTHDPSPGFREMLERALHYLGVDDADLRP